MNSLAVVNAVAVDGPAGAGKSTVARRLATLIHYLYLDTGAMYRALALKSLHHGIDLRDESALAGLLAETSIDLYPGENGTVSVILDGANVSNALRAPQINASVAQVAGFALVRQDMVARQREMARQGGVVMDGRDIGTYVLPNARVKFFLMASLDARAERRYRELRALGFDIELERIRDEIQHRDFLDSSRDVAPLAQADDAILIDTTQMEIEEVVSAMLETCRLRLP